MKEGIDVSFWQGDIDWLKVAGQKEFAMIKATQGRSSSGDELFTDRRFTDNITGASAAGMECGVYHFFTASTAEQAIREADYFISVITPYKSKINLWAVADVEDDTFLSGLSKEELTAVVQVFCDRVAAAGFLPMVYANSYYSTARIGDIERAERWLALWRTDLSKPEGYGNISMWQHTSSGTVDGINGRVDLNIGYYTELPGDVSTGGTPVTGAIAVGDTVRVKNPVIYGTNDRFKLYFDKYTVMEINGDRAVIGVDGVVTAAVNVNNLEKIGGDGTAGGGTPGTGAIAAGDTVRVKNPVIYGSQMRFKLYFDKYTVMELNGDRAVIGVDGVVTAAVNVNNLEKI